MGALQCSQCKSDHNTPHISQIAIRNPDTNDYEIADAETLQFINLSSTAPTPQPSLGKSPKYLSFNCLFGFVFCVHVAW